MKKLFIFLIFGFLTLGLQSQTRAYWPLSSIVNFDSIKVPVTDTVIWLSGIGDMSSFLSTWEFDMSRLDSSVSVNFGGGTRILRNSPRLYSFNKIQSDSLPYTLSRTKWKTTTNGITQNTKILPVVASWNYYFVAIKVTRLGCTAGKYLLFNVKFHN
jgi:hypothetical protein